MLSSTRNFWVCVECAVFPMFGNWQMCPSSWRATRRILLVDVFTDLETSTCLEIANKGKLCFTNLIVLWWKDSLVCNEGVMDLTYFDLAVLLTWHPIAVMSFWSNGRTGWSTTRGVATKCVTSNWLFSNGVALSLLLQPVLLNIFINIQRMRWAATSAMVSTNREISIWTSVQ